jgi:hypothetical protein
LFGRGDSSKPDLDLVRYLAQSQNSIVKCPDPGFFWMSMALEYIEKYIGVLTAAGTVTHATLTNSK